MLTVENVNSQLLVPVAMTAACCHVVPVSVEFNPLEP